MAELLLELLCEEIPARMQRRAIDDLTGLLRDKLAVAEIPATRVRGYVTPRRLALIGEGIPEVQPDRTEERRGPRIGAPQPAIDGFLRSTGLASIGQCEIRNTGRGEFYFAVLHHAGRPAAQVLPEIIRAAMAELPWSKSMRYPASSLRWVRPLTSIICLFDGEVLPLPLDRVPVGRTTRGHRFLSPGEICVGSAADYLDRLGEAFVVLDQDCRKEVIRRGLDQAVAAAGQSLKPDPELLDEVAGLVEFPVVLAGAIDADFMTLPPEVLAAAMRAHQKYFSCMRTDGTPAPRFLFVANNLAPDGGKTIIAGNERVLRARLADARFFWDQDRRFPLESRVGALADRVFHAKLGSMRDKTVRMEALAGFLAGHVPGADVVRSRRAVRLAKADLSTGMVAEFPELQGIMGRYYALHDGEDRAVAAAIGDHYRPLGPNDSCPNFPESVVAALADKIDSLVTFFSIGERPTGSRDPFGLRRAALGIIRLILENGLRIQLSTGIGLAISSLMSDGSFNPRILRDRLAASDIHPNLILYELVAFIVERLIVHLREQGVRHDQIAAIRHASGEWGGEDDLVRLVARVRALSSFLAGGDGVNLLIAYRRAVNIVGIEERRDGCPYDGEVKAELLCQPEEIELHGRLHEAALLVGTLMAQEEFEEAMLQLARLRRPVDEFFEKVTVNCEDQSLRGNRLQLLSQLRSMLNQVADFSQIEG